MTEHTSNHPTPTAPDCYSWCHWHKGIGLGVRLITVIEQGSGPGVGHYACARCRAHHHLTPFAE